MKRQTSASLWQGWHGPPIHFCLYMGLRTIAEAEEGLPDDIDAVQSITGLDAATLQDIWPLFTSQSVRNEHGRWIPLDIHKEQEHRRIISQKRALAGRRGGKATQAIASHPTQAIASTLSDADTPKQLLQAIASQTAEVQHSAQLQDQAKTGNQAIASPLINKSIHAVTEEEGEAIALIDVLQSLFPGEAWRVHQDLALQCFRVNVMSGAVLQRWPDWISARYPGKLQNVFLFKDTLAQFAREAQQGETPSYSVGERFILSASYNVAVNHKTQQLSVALDQASLDRVRTEGKRLDQMAAKIGLNGKSKEWAEAGLTPAAFRQFWQVQHQQTKLPSPPSVTKYFPEFLRQAKEQMK